MVEIAVAPTTSVVTMGAKRNRHTTVRAASIATPSRSMPTRFSTMLACNRRPRGSLAEPVEGGRRQEAHDGEDGGDQRHAEQRLTRAIELAESLCERCGQQERGEDLHTGQHHPQLLQEPVVTIAELGPIEQVVEILGGDLSLGSWRLTGAGWTGDALARRHRTVVPLAAEG